jgi:hypothetical protein
MGVVSAIDLIMQRYGVSRDEAKRIKRDNEAELKENEPEFKGALPNSAINNLDAE